MKERTRFSKIRVISLGVLLLLSACSSSFRYRTVAEMDQDPGLVEGGMAAKWRKYIFDIRITTSDKKTIPQCNLYNVVKQGSPSSPELVFASSIGSSSADGPGVTVKAITGLWEEPTMKRPRGAVYVELYMDKEPGDEVEQLAPNSYKIKAGYVCYGWAQMISVTNLPSLLAEVIKNNPDDWSQSLPLNVPITTFSLWDLKTNQWDIRYPLSAKVPLAPYRIGKYWVIPAEIEFEKPDFESNCLGRTSDTKPPPKRSKPTRRINKR